MEPSPKKLTAEQRRIESAVRNFIQDNGAFVVSIPGIKTMRFEVFPWDDTENPIPEFLKSKGYNVYLEGTRERLTGRGPVQVSVYFLEIPNA